MRKKIIVLPWPPKELNPNSRCHWATKARAVKAYRKNAGWLAATSKVKVGAGAIHLSITFLPPNNRKRDLDGCLSSIKAGLDGIADFFGVDDSRFALTIAMGNVCEGGWVSIEVLDAE